MNIFVEKLEEHKFKLCGLITVIPALILCKRRFLSGVQCTSNQRLDGKIVIVTGSNSGIGKEAALDFAKRGAFVIMACRDLEKSQVVCNQIKNKSKNENVVVEYLDLESLESVKKFSTKILNNYKEINILVNNAGIMGCPYVKTKDGFEKHFQVNYLGHYLLTRFLLTRIQNTPQSRIINVTSKLYENGYVYWNDVNMEANYEAVSSYKQSKLCNILFTNYLARLLKKNDEINVNVFSVSPGIVLTNLSRYFYQEFSFLKKIAYFVLYPVVWFLMKNPKMGAQTTIYCAVEPSLSNKTGLFYRDCKEQPLLPHATNEEEENRLWELSENLLDKWLE